MDAVTYSLQVDVTYSSADYQYSVILQQENSAEFIAMQERVCSQVSEDVLSDAFLSQVNENLMSITSRQHEECTNHCAKTLCTL